jgi:iron complex transport system substrate-binding protein
MKLTRIISALLLISIFVLAGCQTASPTTPVKASTSVTAVQFPLTFTDDAGRSITLKAMPKRLISLSPSNTEMVFAMGLGDQLFGVTTYCNYPEAALAKPKMGGFDDVDIEKVVAAQPDLILASDLHTAKVVPALENLNIPVMVIRPGTIVEILRDINLIGGITGKSSEALDLTTALQKRVDSTTTKISALKGEKPRVLYITWHDPIWTSGDDTIIGELINKTGGVNIAKDLTGYQTMTLEAVIEKNPQIIIVMSSMGDQTSLDYINSEPRLKVTDALKNKQLYLIDADLFGRTTPRIVDALEQLAKITQPSLFK